MGDFDWDGQRLIQIIIILFVFFAGFVRMLFGALMKKRGPEGGGKFMPPKDLQEFLKEIRGERAETEKRPPPALEPAERQAKLQGERAKRDHDAFRGRDAARDRGRPARRDVQEGRPPTAAKADPAGQGERKESVHEYLEQLKKESLAEEESREATVEAEEPAWDPLHPPPARPLSRADEEFAVRFGRLTESEPAPRAHLRRGLQEIQQGLTLREAIVAQTILGPPRSRDPLRARPGGRGGPQRSPGEGAPGRG